MYINMFVLKLISVDFFTETWYFFTEQSRCGLSCYILSFVI